MRWLCQHISKSLLEKITIQLEESQQSIHVGSSIQVTLSTNIELCPEVCISALGRHNGNSHEVPKHDLRA
ncbi:hypothetical protein NC651_007247 [Populus alba x Populus x berolinensis]|nr:hypothetical protein NC651_007247 [Populus alba x Populus x berolinensis]